MVWRDDGSERGGSLKNGRARGKENGPQKSVAKHTRPKTPKQCTLDHKRRYCELSELQRATECRYGRTGRGVWRRGRVSVEEGCGVWRRGMTYERGAGLVGEGYRLWKRGVACGGGAWLMEEGHGL